MAPIDPGNRRGRCAVGNLEPQRNSSRSTGVTRGGLRLRSPDSIALPTAEAQRGDADRQQRSGNENAFVPQWDLSAATLVLSTGRDQSRSTCGAGSMVAPAPD